MPALLMHLRGAEAIRDRLPSSFSTAVDQAPWAYQLGSFLVDLPLFDGFWTKVALFLLHRPYPESSWATVIHTRGAASLVAALLRQAREGHRTELLALVAGVLTHIALDRATHPAIEEAVRLHLRPVETPSQLHEDLENYQCLRWHREHRGCNGLGTPLLKEGVTMGPKRRSDMPRWLKKTFAQSLGEAYGTTPRERELSRWVVGVCGYRDLLSTPFATIGIRSSERLAERRPWVASVVLEPALEEGVELALRYLSTAVESLDDPGTKLVEALGDGPLV